MLQKFSKVEYQRKDSAKTKFKDIDFKGRKANFSFLKILKINYNIFYLKIQNNFQNQIEFIIRYLQLIGQLFYKITFKWIQIISIRFQSYLIHIQVIYLPQRKRSIFTILKLLIIFKNGMLKKRLSRYFSLRSLRGYKQIY
ncbi:unnamed protein product [Paramecium primaurelia]|uniref:Uncharacterized protein n=1 Tax=Paramecium primaurelia TaxID=5886 RepID=A0A8S1QVA1_PARPR|nr:unnamed protein product [Paramecium primaurelia]